MVNAPSHAQSRTVEVSKTAKIASAEVTVNSVGECDEELMELEKEYEELQRIAAIEQKKADLKRKLLDFRNRSDSQPGSSRWMPSQPSSTSTSALSTHATKKYGGSSNTGTINISFH